MSGNAMRRGLLGILVLLAWEALGRVGLLPAGAVPMPSGIVMQFVLYPDIYLPHILATLKSSFIGLVFGSCAGIVAAILFCRFPRTELVFRGVNITLFAIPKIVVGPLLVLFLAEGQSQIALAGMSVYFPVMTATLVGLREIDPRLIDVVRTYGGGENRLMCLVRLPGALPEIVSGLKIAGSLAVVGAIIGEFGSGERWGLGTFLLGSLSYSDAARLWAISLSCVGVAYVYLIALEIVRRLIDVPTMQVTLASKMSPGMMSAYRFKRPGERIFYSCLALLLPFFLWWVVLALLNLTPLIAPSPAEIVSFLLFSANAETARADILSALGTTVPTTLLGMVLGLAVALCMAIATFLKPRLERFITPFAMFMQNMPVIALTPLILLTLGRDLAASLAIAVLVVFFPAFVLVSHGLKQVPRPALEIVTVYGGSRLKQLLKVGLPYALPYLVAAAKLVAPRALLGVLIAEWLLTGTGLGHLLEFSRAMFDYQMVWSGALTAVLISIGLYQAISLFEAVILRRMLRL